ncbi:MAG: type II secretion system protein [Sulfurovum sp.]|nr:MAG: type II secretion system protein [Sulfurovum sp.]
MRYFNIKNRHAFTMIELIMVIIVLGILASLALPRLDRDLRQEAADSILSDIRYTQHLALMDDMHEFDDPKWQQKYWRIVFSSCSDEKKHYYMIGSDTNKSNSTNAFFARTEAAIDPVNNKPMFGDLGLCNSDGDSTVSDRMFITKKFGIKAVSFNGGCNRSVNGSGGKHLGFDHLGRPHHGFSKSPAPNYASYMTQACVMTFTLSDNSIFQINIAPETGYAHIVNQNAS